MVKLKKVSYTSHRTQEKAFNFEIEGGRKLHGTIVINTSKNGALVLLCASLLNKGETILHNIPKIEEVHRVIEVLESIGVTVLWRGHTVIIRPPQKLTLSTIDKESAERTRSIIMFLGPLLHHMSHFSLPQSGGCKLGGRTVRPHFYALEPLGVSIKTTEHTYEVRYKKLRTSEIIMYESGDTATENVIMAAALIPGVTTIKYASANYQVQELCFFLEKAGIVIDGIGTTTLHVHGVEKIDTKIVRILNTYGPKMRKDDGRVVPNFINQALKNVPITVYGDGKQTRSFCYISDMIGGMIKMMNQEKVIGPVNLGNPKDNNSYLSLGSLIILL